MPWAIAPQSKVSLGLPKSRVNIHVQRLVCSVYGSREESRFMSLEDPTQASIHAARRAWSRAHHGSFSRWRSHEDRSRRSQFRGITYSGRGRQVDSFAPVDCYHWHRLIELRHGRRQRVSMHSSPTPNSASAIDPVRESDSQSCNASIQSTFRRETGFDGAGLVGPTHEHQSYG